MTQLHLPLRAPHSATDPAAGRAAKATGMAAAEAGTEPDWATACDAAIAEMAGRGEPFQAADLVSAGLINEPEHPNRWGPRFGAASRAGVIRDAGVVPSKRATVHRSLCRQWIGAHATEGQAAA